MSDERGRRRDTPTGMGPGKAPRGAGLSGNLPSGSRNRQDGGQEKHDTPTGLSPVKIHNEPPVRARPAPAHRAHDASEGGPWDSAATPARAVNVEPRAVRSPPPPPPSRAHPAAEQSSRPLAYPAAEQSSRPAPARAAADGFAITHQAEAPGRAPTSAHPGSRPLEVHKPSLRLKLDTQDPEYETRAVRVPKRRAPLLLGVLLLLGMLGGGALLWIDAHGGVDNFVAQLRHLADPSSPAPTSGVVQQPPAAAEPQVPAAPATPPPAAAAAPVAAPDKPAEAQAELNPQVATGEVEEPAAAETPQPPAAEPKPAAKPAPAPRPAVPREPVVRRPPVRRDPVIKIQPLGDVLSAAPPDPSGREVLPPPDPPAPE